VGSAIVFSVTDTIVAISTPPGRGGIGVVRLSGADADFIARRLIGRAAALEPRHATFAVIREPQDRAATPSGLRHSAFHDVPGVSTVPGGSAAPDVSAASGVSDVIRTSEVPGLSDVAGVSDARGAAMRGVSGAREVGEDARVANPIDQVVVTFFPSPASYTGEDVVEVSAHGNPVVLHAIVAGAMELGARLAEPGEFTLRRFLNGRADLLQAEAVADLVDAVTPLQARAAFDQLQGTLTRAIGEIDAALFDVIARLEASVDFPEEGYHFAGPHEVGGAIDDVIRRVDRLLADARRGRMLREGLQVAIVGPPNAGKSSLFNRLAGADRAIVTEIPGTTRDLVTEVVDVEGLRVTLVDTAGLRDTSDRIESEGVARSRQAVGAADLVLVVLDRSRPIERAEADSITQIIDNKALIAANKSDLDPAWRREDAVDVSAVTGEGLDELRHRMVKALDIEPRAERPAITNLRHIDLVTRSREALVRAREAALFPHGAWPEECVLADLQEARGALEEVTGRRTPDQLLEHIFSRFCIGK